MSTAEPSLETRLAALCTCVEDDFVDDDEDKCIYCEARLRIEAQDRTLRLAQERIASLQRSDTRFERSLNEALNSGDGSYRP
jgi:hypothetical protein